MNYFHKINRLKEGTDFEKKHTSFIDCRDSVKADEIFEVRIYTEVEHPMEDNHYIQWVELFMNDIYLGRAEFTQFLKPEVVFKVKAPNESHKGKSFKLRALMRCNLHGVWEFEKEVKIE